MKGAGLACLPALLMCFLLAGCGSSTSPAASPSTVIPTPALGRAVLYGTVTDASDHSPLAGATISVQAGKWITTTNAFGQYHLSIPGNTSVSVQPGMNGYSGQLAEGQIPPGQRYQLNFALQRITGTPLAPSPPTVFGSHP